MYRSVVPKLWEDTIESHRNAVRDAILDATWDLVRQHGLLSVTMSHIAAEAGIGRATLYKYFPDVEAILLAHHTRHVAAHLQHLAALRDQPTTLAERLEAVLHEYARICHFRGRHGGDELAALLHRGEAVSQALDQVRDIFSSLLADAVVTGDVRADVSASELADYCLNALAAAAGLPDEAAVERLVTVTRDGIRPR
jgi:AcrR family transcriptional regulator